LREVKRAVSIPVLRKDFTIHGYQVYEAAAAGADALLLIAAAHDDDALYDLRTLTEDHLGMDALVEVHTVEELVRARRCQSSLIGVNNRDLHTFEVSLEVSAELVRVAGPHAVLISESGLGSKADLERLHALGYKGFLVGETLMRADDPGEALRGLLGKEV
jgi:indole-3-glycerol phosphate synthase